jgi:hypothetical protein
VCWRLLLRLAPPLSPALLLAGASSWGPSAAATRSMLAVVRAALLGDATQALPVLAVRAAKRAQPICWVVLNPRCRRCCRLWLA